MAQAGGREATGSARGRLAGLAPAPPQQPGRLRTNQFSPGPWRRLWLRLSEARLGSAGRIGAAIERERQTGGLFHLVAVLFALGILAYFAAPAEPVLVVVAASAAGAGLMAWRQQHHGVAHAVLIAASVCLAGMSAAQVRVQLTDTPVIAREMTARVTGLVIRVDANARGAPRYLIRPESIAGIEAAELPRRLRLSSTSRQQHIVAGDRIAGRARIMPISGPAYPGGYDFAFFARFDGLGGTGFFYGAPAKREGPAGAAPAERAAIALNRLRKALAERIRAGLAGEPGDIAVALITGDRSGIDEATSESLRRSGLAHVLAISGLHMALVALTVIGVMRWLLAWLPAVALRYPVRKWAAGAGLAAATAYLVISGASVATQRAWIMIAVMLAAMLADRRAVTIRNVAVAALIILALAPESLLEPGFQMSFAAAAALVAAYEAWTRRGGRRRADRSGRQPSAPARLAATVSAYFGALLFTSLVAGLATALFAAWHFHRVAPLGLAANALAMPIVSLVVMPTALVSTLAMPYGLERLPLALLGWGIERMMAISDWVNSFGVAGVTGAQSAAFLAAGAAGLAVLTLMRSRLRLIGLAPLAALPLLAGAGPPPDLLVSQDGRAIAVADAAGRLVLLYPRRNRFVSDIWLRAWSGGAAGDRSVVASGCGRDWCAARLRTGLRLEVVYAPRLLSQACASADILVAPRLRWVRCGARTPKLVLKRGDFESHGSHAVWLEEAAGPAPGPAEAAIRVRSAIPAGSRPWHARATDANDDTPPSDPGRRADPAGDQ
ncbi:MAG: competence protein [Alphaproteobacteria bacterium]|nr:MAG: competence protein [Alphaproteobacteria bacterium]